MHIGHSKAPTQGQLKRNPSEASLLEALHRRAGLCAPSKKKFGAPEAGELPSESALLAAFQKRGALPSSTQKASKVEGKTGYETSVPPSMLDLAEALKAKKPKPRVRPKKESSSKDVPLTPDYDLLKSLDRKGVHSGAPFAKSISKKSKAKMDMTHSDLSNAESNLSLDYSNDYEHNLAKEDNELETDIANISAQAPMSSAEIVWLLQSKRAALLESDHVDDSVDFEAPQCIPEASSPLSRAPPSRRFSVSNRTTLVALDRPIPSDVYPDVREVCDDSIVMYSWTPTYKSDEPPVSKHDVTEAKHDISLEDAYEEFQTTPLPDVSALLSPCDVRVQVSPYAIEWKRLALQKIDCSKTVIAEQVRSCMAMQENERTPDVFVDVALRCWEAFWEHFDVKLDVKLKTEPLGCSPSDLDPTPWDRLEHWWLAPDKTDSNLVSKLVAIELLHDTVKQTTVNTRLRNAMMRFHNHHRALGVHNTDAISAWKDIGPHQFRIFARDVESIVRPRVQQLLALRALWPLVPGLEYQCDFAHLASDEEAYYYNQSDKFSHSMQFAKSWESLDTNANLHQSSSKYTKRNTWHSHTFGPIEEKFNGRGFHLRSLQARRRRKPERRKTWPLMSHTQVEYEALHVRREDWWWTKPSNDDRHPIDCLQDGLQHRKQKDASCGIIRDVHNRLLSANRKLREYWPFEVSDFSRRKECADISFYASPSSSSSFSDEQSYALMNFYRGMFPRSGRFAILDLGSSCTSHYPPEISASSAFRVGRRVAVLGMNYVELRANTFATESPVVKDLNWLPELPYEQCEFDFVTCSAAVHLFTEPRKICEEIFRIIRPGGIVMFSFGDKYCSKKTVSMWKMKHIADVDVRMRKRARIVASYLHYCSMPWAEITASDVSTWNAPLVVVTAVKKALLGIRVLVEGLKVCKQYNGTRGTLQSRIGAHSDQHSIASEVEDCDGGLDVGKVQLNSMDQFKTLALLRNATSKDYETGLDRSVEHAEADTREVEERVLRYVVTLDVDGVELAIPASNLKALREHEDRLAGTSVENLPRPLQNIACDLGCIPNSRQLVCEPILIASSTGAILVDSGSGEVTLASSEIPSDNTSTVDSEWCLSEGSSGGVVIESRHGRRLAENGPGVLTLLEEDPMYGHVDLSDKWYFTESDDGAVNIMSASRQRLVVSNGKPCLAEEAITIGSWEFDGKHAWNLKKLDGHFAQNVSARLCAFHSRRDDQSVLVTEDSQSSRMPFATYMVKEQGAQVFSRPALSAPVVGKLLPGQTVHGSEIDGWLLLDNVSAQAAGVKHGTRSLPDWPYPKSAKGRSALGKKKAREFFHEATSRSKCTVPSAWILVEGQSFGLRPSLELLHYGVNT